MSGLRWPKQLLALVLALSALAVQPVQATTADVFAVQSVTTRLQERVYFLNAVFDLQLPSYISRAINQGFELPLVMEIEVYRRIPFWFDEEVVYIKQQYRLNYHSLLDAVSILNVNSGLKQLYPDMSTALDSLTVLLDYPMLDTDNLDRQRSYRARMRLGIDQEELPLPLKSSSLWQNDWTVASEWFEWGVEQ